MIIEFINIGRNKMSWYINHRGAMVKAEKLIRLIKARGALLSNNIEFECVDKQEGVLLYDVFAGMRHVGKIKLTVQNKR